VDLDHRPVTRIRLPAWRLGVLILALMLVTACSGPTPGSSSSLPPRSSTPTATQTPLPTETPDLSSPVGVIAMGHSGLTGEGTGDPLAPAFKNSWATGTAPEVNSVYLRLVAVRPETEGHVQNTATGGAPASALLGLTLSALQTVPVPALAIISTIDSDIQCDGTDPDHLPAFGMAVAKALDAISTASPNTRILVVGQLGRPRVDFVEQLVAHDPSVKPFLTGSGMCDFYDAAGKIVPAHFAALTAIIDAYEAEQARVCALVPHCATDEGARAAYVDKLENFSNDWNHLNVAGQAAEAELIWPVVAKLLEL
jgi:hypothetical protein